MKEYERVWPVLLPVGPTITAEAVRNRIAWLEFNKHVKPRIMAAMNRRLRYCWWRRYRRQEGR